MCGEQCLVQAIQGDGLHRPTVLADKCVGCGTCENACPVDGEAAIRVFPR
ncbi:MAG: 4Fe-4S binding protein [Veillonellales bacterium]